MFYLRYVSETIQSHSSSLSCGSTLFSVYFSLNAHCACAFLFYETSRLFRRWTPPTHVDPENMEKLGPVCTLWIARGILPQLRNSAAIAVVQNRGGKTKYGGITRDPLIHMKKKLGKKNQLKQAKIPLVSEERKQMALTLPISTASLSKLMK